MPRNPLNPRRVFSSAEERAAYRKAYAVQYREKNKASIRKRQQRWYDKNKTRVLKAGSDRWHKGDGRKNYHKWLEANRAKRSAQTKDWLRRNPTYLTDRYKNDTEFRLRAILRRRLNAALKSSSSRAHKTGSAVRDLGCDIQTFKKYIEAKFQPGMTWKNYGKLWQIDHVIPISVFDLTDRTQLLQACHYTNLQPLTAAENLKKNRGLKPLLRATA